MMTTKKALREKSLFFGVSDACQVLGKSLPKQKPKRAKPFGSERHWKTIQSTSQNRIIEFWQWLQKRTINLFAVPITINQTNKQEQHFHRTPLLLAMWLSGSLPPPSLDRQQHSAPPAAKVAAKRRQLASAPGMHPQEAAKTAWGLGTPSPLPPRKRVFMLRKSQTGFVSLRRWVGLIRDACCCLLLNLIGRKWIKRLWIFTPCHVFCGKVFSECDGVCSRQGFAISNRPSYSLWTYLSPVMARPFLFGETFSKVLFKTISQKQMQLSEPFETSQIGCRNGQNKTKRWDFKFALKSQLVITQGTRHSRHAEPSCSPRVLIWSFATCYIARHQSMYNHCWP